MIYLLINIRDLANKIAKVCGYKGKIIWDTQKPDGTPRKKVDTSKLNKLGWEAKTNLDEGLKATLECYKNEISENILRSN